MPQQWRGVGSVSNTSCAFQTLASKLEVLMYDNMKMMMNTLRLDVDVDYENGAFFFNA